MGQKGIFSIPATLIWVASNKRAIKRIGVIMEVFIGWVETPECEDCGSLESWQDTATILFNGVVKEVVTHQCKGCCAISDV